MNKLLGRLYKRFMLWYEIKKYYKKGIWYCSKCGELRKIPIRPFDEWIYDYDLLCEECYKEEIKKI